MRYLVIVCTLFLFGCGIAPKADRSKTFTTKVSWSRDTLQSTYSGYRLLHKMKPLVFDELVIAGNSVDGITAYNKSSGSKVWSIDLKGGVDSASLYDGKIYFGANDGYFYSVDAQTGKKIWTYPVKFEGVGEPLVTQDAVYFQSANHAVYGFDRVSGQKKWIYSRNISSNNSIRGASKPLLHNGFLYIGFADGYMVKLTTSNGTMSWEKKINFNKKFKDVDASPVFSKGLILVSGFDGDLVALNEKGDTEWRTAAGGDSAPLVIDDKVFVSSSDGFIRSLDFKSGKIVWEKKIGKGLPSQVVSFRGLLVVGYSKGELLFVEPSDGSITGSFSTGRGISSASSFSNDKAYFMTVNALLFSLTAKWGIEYEGL